jgi:hypothetical protein
MIKLKMRSPRPLARKASISALTQRERAEDGEQITTKADESASAALMVLLRSPALGSSSRSRNICPSLAGIGPSRPGAPTRLRGTRYASRRRINQRAHFSSAWL